MVCSFNRSLLSQFLETNMDSATQFKKIIIIAIIQEKFSDILNF